MKLTKTLATIFTNLLLMSVAQGAVTLTTLYSFSGPDAANPLGGLVKGTDGNFYGTTSDNSSANINFGTVFRIAPDGTFTNIYRFSGGDDGAWPQLGLLLGRDGNFYDTAHHGANGWGTIFRISTSGNFLTLAALDSLSGLPASLLVAGSDGNFYCVGTSGSGINLGSVFNVMPAGSVNVLASFAGTNGFTGWAFSRDMLFQGVDGNFYGATCCGGPEFTGAFMNPAYGTVFSMAPDGTLTTLASFNGTNGAYISSLIQ